MPFWHPQLAGPGLRRFAIGKREESYDYQNNDAPDRAGHRHGPPECAAAWRRSGAQRLINGRVMSMLIDDDPAGRKMSGLIGIQVHKGPPMKIEVKNIRIKTL